MFKTIRNYFRYKAIKYRTLTATVNDMSDRAKDVTLRGLTLTELGQIDYMGAELARIETAHFEAQRQAEANLVPPDPDPEQSIKHAEQTGQYL